MKMKTAILLLNAAAALSLLTSASSCTKTRTDIGSGTGTYIEFASVLTKTPVNTPDDMSEFAVWGFYNNPVDAEYTTVFDNVRVYKADNGWTYENLQRWVSNMEYDFYAIYPSTEVLKHVGLVNENGVRPYLGIANYDAANSKYENAPVDLLMAVNKSISYNPDNGMAPKVRLTFHHLLSRIELQCRTDEVSKDVEGFEPIVYNAKIYGLYEQGSYSSADFDPNDKSSIRYGWKVPDTGGEVITNYENPYADSDISTEGIEVPVDATSTASLLSDIMVFPQQLTQDVCFSIEFSTNGGSTRKVQHIQLASMPLTVWEAGTTYRYTFTISADGRIYFDIPTVNEWNDASGGIIIVD